MNIIINQLQKELWPKSGCRHRKITPFKAVTCWDWWAITEQEKTTLFRLMLDLLKADGGSVHIGNIDVSRSEEWKNITGAFIDEGS